MGTSGKLTRSELSFSTPSDSPLYPPPPYDYPGATLLVIEFVTDPDSAARILPAQAELTDPPMAGLVFADYPQSTLGPYREVILYLNATHQNRKVQYAARFYVTTDVAMAAGREQAGIPKKIGEIRFEGASASTLATGQVLRGSLERPSGTPIASASVRLTKSLLDSSKTGPTAAPTQSFDYLSLRVIPSPTLGDQASLCQLIETNWTMTPSEIWEVEIDQPPTFATGQTVDSFAAVPILQVTSTMVIRGLMHVAENTNPLTWPF